MFGATEGDLVTGQHLVGHLIVLEGAVAAFVLVQQLGGAPGVVRAESGAVAL